MKIPKKTAITKLIWSKVDFLSFNGINFSTFPYLIHMPTMTPTPKNVKVHPLKRLQLVRLDFVLTVFTFTIILCVITLQKFKKAANSWQKFQ